MTDFIIFKQAVQKQIAIMSSGGLFKVDINPDNLWYSYLEAYPPEENQIFKEKREYDCAACRQFVRNYGSIVGINQDFELVSIWDCFSTLPYPFHTVAKKLSVLVKAHEIKDIFLSESKKIGLDHNIQRLESGELLTWNHFSATVPANCVSKPKYIDSKLGRARTNKTVFKRALDDITPYAIETTLDLIDQGSLYRGDEHKDEVLYLARCKSFYDELAIKNRDTFAWVESRRVINPGIRNTSIGTLLVALSDDVDLNSAVASYENKVAPENPLAKPITKWGNNFSWVYNGDVADSIKERVKRAGGQTKGEKQRRS